MSQQTATARATSRGTMPARRPARPLTVVSAAPARSQSAFVALCAMLLFAGLIGVLLLNTVMAKGSFEIERLQNRSSTLADAQESLGHAVNAQSAPAELARRAMALGMVPSQSAAFLRLSDGKILGVAVPATRQPGFTVAAQVPSATTPAGGPTTGTTKPPTPAGTTKPPTPAGTTKPTTPAGTTKPTTPAGTTKPTKPATAPSPAPTH